MRKGLPAILFSTLLIPVVVHAAKPSVPDPWVHPFVSACEAYKATGDRTNRCFRHFDGGFRLVLSIKTQRGQAAADYCLVADDPNADAVPGFKSFSARAAVRTLNGRTVDSDELVDVLLAQVAEHPEWLAYNSLELDDKFIRTPRYKGATLAQLAAKAHYCSADAERERPAAAAAGSGSSDDEAGDR